MDETTTTTATTETTPAAPQTAPETVRETLDRVAREVAPKDDATQPKQADGDKPAPQETKQAEAGSRDERGRFAPKQTDQRQGDAPKAPIAEAAKQPDQRNDAKGSEPAPKAPAIEPPVSWSGAAKSKWPTLDPDIQREVMKREGEVQKGFEARAAELGRLKDMDAALAPHQDRLRTSGISPGVYVGRLAEADRLLANPTTRLAAFAQVARMYGIDPAQLAQPQGTDSQATPQDPRIQALEARVNELTGQLTSRAQAEQAQVQTSIQSDIETFARDPANIYFADLKDDMATLLTSGIIKASGPAALREAYDRAAKMHPDVSERMIADRLAKAEREKAEAAKQRAESAMRGSVSVRGAGPTGTGMNGAQAPLGETVRQTLDRVRAEMR